jgi:hypothetical protein
MDAEPIPGEAAMGEHVFHQESKEFQLKIDVDKVLPKQGRQPGPADKALFHAVGDAMRLAVDSLGHGGSEVILHDNAWQRDGIRYDTADARLKANQLTLAIEATDKRTKLKFKQHNFIPELLFAKPTEATVYPDIDASGGYKDHDTKLKREQDIHFDNIKTCASGSLFVKGRQTEVQDSSFFDRYFPGLEKVLPVPTPLTAVSHWNEVVFDDMRTSWKHVLIDSWTLVDRWDHQTKELLESELSFKIAKEMDADWDYRLMRNANALYLALRATGVFRELPPIFSYSDPVSSFEIMRVPE